MLLIVSLNPAIDRIYIVPNFNLDHIHRTGNILIQSGGKGVNVARVAKILATPSLVTGFLSNVAYHGYASSFIQYELEQSGIAQSWSTIQGDARNCLIIADPIAHTQTVVNETGPRITPDEVENFFSHFATLLDQHLLTNHSCELSNSILSPHIALARSSQFRKFLVVIAGSIPASLTANIYSQIITLSHQAGMPVLLDAKGTELQLGIKSKPDIIKVNLEEITDWCENKNTIRQAVQKGEFSLLIEHGENILALGVQHLIISLGAMGAIWMTHSATKSFQTGADTISKTGADTISKTGARVWYATAPVVTVVNAIGSGDAMSAAIACELLHFMQSQHNITTTSSNTENICNTGYTAYNVEGVQSSTVKLLKYCDIQEAEHINSTYVSCLASLPEALIQRALTKGVAGGTANATVGGLRFSYELFQKLQADVSIKELQC